MAETLVARVRNRIGTYTNATQLLEWMELGSRIVYQNLPEIKANEFSTPVAVGSGLDTTNYLIYSFSKNGPGRFILADKEYYAQNDSIFAGSSASPIGWFKGKRFYTYPTGCTALVLEIPILVSTDTLIDSFPYEYEEIPILYASIQALQAKVSTTLATLDGLTWDSGNDLTTPTAPSAPSFTYIDAIVDTFNTEDIIFTEQVTYIPPSIALTYTNMETALTDEDEVYAGAEGQKLQIKLEEIQKNLLNSLNSFQESQENTKNSLSIAIENARMATQALMAKAEKTTDIDAANKSQETARQVQEYQAKLGKYKSEIENYGMLVQKEVGRLTSLAQKTSAVIQGMLALVTSLKTEYKELLMELRK